MALSVDITAAWLLLLVPAMQETQQTVLDSVGSSEMMHSCLVNGRCKFEIRLCTIYFVQAGPELKF